MTPMTMCADPLFNEKNRSRTCATSGLARRRQPTINPVRLADRSGSGQIARDAQASWSDEVDVIVTIAAAWRTRS